jgi:hypothetical protein
MKRLTGKIILLLLLFKGMGVHAQVSTMTGINTTAPKSTLEVNGSVAEAIKVVNSNYTLTDKDHTLILSGVAGAGTITVKFPSAASCPGRIYIIANYTAPTANTVAANPQVFSSFDSTTAELKAVTGTGALSATLNSVASSAGPSAGIQVTNLRTTWQSDGTTWWLIGV